MRARTTARFGRSGARLRLAPPRPLDRRLFRVRERELDNGLGVRLVRDPSVPAVSLYTFFRAGSRDERPGITGIAHLLEHMMFNGSARFGPKEFDRLLEGAGGHSNAYTSHDLTAYHEDFAREALGLALRLESDRMRALSLAPRMLASEREVVKEERRQGVDNDPFGLMDETLNALAYQAHAYRWPIIGWMSDLDAIGRDDCVAFFKTFYAPNNAVLWAVGDLDVDRTLEAIDRAYGGIPRGPAMLRRADVEPPQRGERRAKLSFPAHAQALSVGFRAPAAADPLSPALDVLQYLLGAGEGSRLVRRLVYEEMLAANVWVDFTWRADPGLFVVVAELNPGVAAERALAVLDLELARVAERGPGRSELVRAKGLLRSHLLRELATNNGRAHALGSHEILLGDWRTALELPARYAAVGAPEVQGAARALFDPSRRSVVTLAPDASPSPRRRSRRGP